MTASLLVHNHERTTLDYVYLLKDVDPSQVFDMLNDRISEIGSPDYMTEGMSFKVQMGEQEEILSHRFNNTLLVETYSRIVDMMCE